MEDNKTVITDDLWKWLFADPSISFQTVLSVSEKKSLLWYKIYDVKWSMHVMNLFHIFVQIL